MSKARQASSEPYLPPRARPRDPRCFALVRRGAKLGWVRGGAFEPDGATARRARTGSAHDVAHPFALSRDEIERRWRAAEPIALRGAVATDLAKWKRAITGSLAWFERLRGGESFQDELWRRLDGTREFAAGGVTCDVYDTREIEKVYAHGLGAHGRGARDRVIARDLYAKLQWIAHDERDASLRVRFSFGSESLLEWTKDPRRAVWSDRYANAVFPETAAVLERAPLLELLRALARREIRLSERIVYNNAPGGGAVFHHDAEPHQLGVLYSQLRGETAWIALPKRALAAHVAAHAADMQARTRSGARRRSALAKRVATARAALRALEAEDDGELYALLNEDASFARRLVLDGRAFRMRAGDALVLPSRGPDDTCWHSVFALGDTPSLSHSYGIFGARRTRAEIASESRRYDMAQAR